MKFAFLVHPLTQETMELMELQQKQGSLRKSFGWDFLRLQSELHASVAKSVKKLTGDGGQVRVIDELSGLTSRIGAQAEGRLYEIPMDAFSILEDPDRALHYMLEAANMAATWGAKVVGLGSMTGIVGSHGEYMAQHAPIPVTTGNSLTVYAAVQNLLAACRATEIDLSEATLAIVGIPGSIATAAALILAPRCKSLVLVARRPSSRASAIAAELGAQLLTDLPEALKQADVVLSSTSSGGCIDQSWLQPGTLLIDVGVPTDVLGSRPTRDDCLILSGGLSGIPETMALDSGYLWFHRGAMPSCLGETMVLALDGCPECFSLGRKLDPQRIEEIGHRAETHGITFSRMYCFGLALSDDNLVAFRKVIARRTMARSGKALQQPSEPAGPPTPERLADRAQERHRRYVNPVLIVFGGGSGLVKTFVRGEGMRVWDESGREYLDFVAGYGSLNLGHNPPEVVAALRAAIDAGSPGFSPAAVNPLAGALAEQLATLSPPGLEMTFFCNSGTEAVEAALKLARRATGRRGLLYCDRSFHGKTLGSLSITGNPAYQQPFEPLVPGAEPVEFGDIDAASRALNTRRFAAFCVEPIQGEGGMIVPPPDYLPAVQELCRKTETLLVVDEVQTGLGRTGRLFASEHSGIEPDIMAIAKSLGGGMVPIGAMLARRDVWHRAYGNIQSFALHTNTFGGGSLACAAGLATMKVLRRGDVIRNAEARGAQMLEGLRRLVGRYSFLREARGQGLLLGLEFEPAPPFVVGHWQSLLAGDIGPYLVPGLSAITKGLSATHVIGVLMRDHGIYTQVARSNPCVLRLQPPLIVTEEQVAKFLAATEACCEELDWFLSTFDRVIAKSVTGQHGGSGQERARG
jgi:putrescine aminotransferase